MPLSETTMPSFYPFEDDLTGVSGDDVVGVVLGDGLSGIDLVPVFDLHFGSDRDVQAVLASALSFDDEGSADDDFADIRSEFGLVEGLGPASDLELGAVGDLGEFQLLEAGDSTRPGFDV